MRPDANAERIHDLLDALGRRASPGDRLYVAGGASAVLVGWRGATRDVDLRLEGDGDGLLRAIAELKAGHMPFALQALAKLQRGFEQDLADVSAMLSRGLANKAEISAALAEAAPGLYRFPKVNAQRLAAAVGGLPDG